MSRIFNLLSALCLTLMLGGVVQTASAATVLALGDSLTAGYGLPPGDGFTEQLEAALRADGHDITVLNAGVSGDTSAGGLARLDWALAAPVDLVIVELGANDGLRGLDPAQTERNLDAILSKLKRKDIPVLLTGMRAPPNMGERYAKEFDGLFARLAHKHGVDFYPFFLDGVAADPALNQGDGIHPNPDGVAIIASRIAPFVLRALEDR